jgi:predicted HAD superfamily phosphohydrolase
MNVYKIIEGRELRPNGPKSLIKPEDLTDELAEFFIKKNPALLGTIIEKIATVKKEQPKKEIKKETTTKKPQPKKVITTKTSKTKKK